MLLRKRIASIMLAVVMVFTAAFFVSDDVSASDVATISEIGSENTDNNKNTSLNGTAAVDGGDVTAKANGKNWTEGITSVTGTEWASVGGERRSINPSVHNMYEIIDKDGKRTVAYCMQPYVLGPDTNGMTYTDGHKWVEQMWGEEEGNNKINAMLGAAKFLHGGTNADPNVGTWQGNNATRNYDDGGTFGTYLIGTTDSNNDGIYEDLKAVRGLMIAGKVYEMTDEEARALSSVVVHSIIADSNVTQIIGKSGRDLMPAYNHLMGIANGTYDKVKENGDGIRIDMDTKDYYSCSQKFIWEIYNPSTSTWEPYTSTDKLDRKYINSSDEINLRVKYTSYGLCNNLTQTTSTGKMTVKHNFNAFNVGSSSALFNYFDVIEGTGNNVPFTVTYDKITAGFTKEKDYWFRGTTEYKRNTFNQSATITVDATNFNDASSKLSIGITMEEGATNALTKTTESGKTVYSAKMYQNEERQDMLFLPSNRSVSTSSNITLDVDLTGSIKIHKYSANTSITDGNACYSLEGATFGVFKSRADAQAATNAVAVIVTDKNGNGEALDIPLDTYYVKETKASPGYRLNETIYTANITDDVPVTFNVPEEPGNDPAEVIARKKSSEGDIYIEGAVFAIRYYDIQFTENALVDPATLGEKPERTWYLKTNERGYASLYRSDCILQNSDELYLNDIGLAVIPVGTITVQEIEAPEGYIKDDTVYPFSITDNPTGIPSVEVMNERTIPNSPMKQPFEITKYGETKDGGKNPLAGAGFSVCNVKDLKEVSKTYEPAEGEVIVASDDGKYYIWDSAKAVVLTADGKTELITDSKGYAKSIDLEYGKYIGRETTVPATFLPVDEFTINVTKDSREAIKYEFIDGTTMTGEIRIHKSGNILVYDKSTGIYKDEEIVLEGIKFGIYANRDIYSNDGKNTLIYKKGDLVETVTTDAKGDAASSDTLPLGNYRIHEENVPEGYISVKDEIVVLDADDDLKYVAGKVVYETVSIINVVQKAQIKVYKTNDDKTVYLKDAEFGLFVYDDKLKDKEDYISKGVCVASGKTDEKGELTFDGYYPLGKYSIIELKAPKGYISDVSVHVVEAKASNENIEYILVDDTFINTIMKQPFEITKYGETKDGGKNPLAGAGFSVCKVDDLKEVSKDYEPAEGEVIVTSDEGKFYIWDSSKVVVLTSDGKTEIFTDAKGYAESIELEYGKYIGMETTVPATFLPVEEFTINVTKDSREAIRYEFIDKLILTGRIDIHKTGEDRTYNEELGEFENKEIVLEGIQFDIYAAEDLFDIHGNLKYASGTLVESIITDKNGDASSSDDLPLGKFRVHENVPAGYEQMNDEYVILSRECETIKVTDEDGAEKQIVYSVLKVKNKLLIPEIKTTAKDSVTLNNVADPSATTTSIDTISHTNLIPGKEYEIKTVLLDKETQKPLIIDGQEITGITKYKPVSSSGQVDVSVTYNSSLLAGKQVVFFEYIYTDGKLVALHADINDGGQTITYPPETPPDTPPTGDGAPLGIIIGLMVLAGAGLIGMICFKKLPKKIK